MLFSSANNRNLPKKLIIISLIIVVFLIIVIGVFFYLNRNGINQKPEDLKSQSTPQTTPQKQVSNYQPQIDKLDALVASVNALPKSFDPAIKEEMFKSTKEFLTSF